MKSEIWSAVPEASSRRILSLCRRLKKAGYEAFVVGGAVRDLIMKKSPGDFDIATDARPEKVAGLFRRVIPTGIKHGTVTVLIEGEAFEVTTYRAEGTYSDGRRPDEVRFSTSLSEDLMRRDFTMNALAFDPDGRELIDEHGGLGDIRDRLVRTIGDARERFFEDGLRPVRACRFRASLEFDLEEKTKRALALPEVLERSALVAVERFTDELRKGFAARRVSLMLAPLEESGLLDLFLRSKSGPLRTDGEIRLLLDETHPAHAAFKIMLWWKSAGVAPEEFPTLGKTLRLSGDFVRDLEWYERFLEFREGWEADSSPARTRRFLSGLKERLGDRGGDFLDGLPSATNRWGGVPFREDLKRIYETEPLVIGDLRVNGKDLLERGYAGQEVGKKLRALLDAVLMDPTRNERASLLKMLDR